MLILRISKQKINRTRIIILLGSLIFISSFGILAMGAGIDDDELGTKNEFTESANPLAGPFSRPSRWDHNLILSIGNASGSWLVDELDPTDDATLTFYSRAFFMKLLYAFHLPIVGDLGYTLGSSMGYYWEAHGQSEFRKASSIHFPGIHIGLIYNFTPSFRFEIAGETYLERLDKLSMTSNGSTYTISVTMRPNYDFIVASDFFYSSQWGLRIEWHTREVQTHPPGSSEGQIIGAKVVKKDTWIGLGIIYHLFAS